ncbi:ATP-binding protein [Sulfurimonas sp.]|uniref:hybrid sensor histidine kinase/response regulator n=1 Tax=Sulfurimonas sp. TaxID=2022749 RepID=UPI0035631D48
MNTQVPNLTQTQEIFISSKDIILSQWLSYDSPQKILKQHDIDRSFFLAEYANGVFDYFMGIIAGEVEIGNCPIMQNLMAYLKNREISADELFEICSHFRRSMIDFSYDKGLDSKEMANEISYIFDKNFRGILKYYTDTIFQKLINARLEADKASQAKEYFLSNMSHEIRTPLNAILGFVNLLIDEDVSKKHRTYLDIILNSGENLLSIINDILDFSKLRSGEFTIEPKIFSLHDEISHTMELFVASANVKDITITSFIDPHIPKELYADALRIKQILSNFLSNAIKFTPQGGHISVEASCKNGVLNVSVADNGIGIAEQDIQNIFTAFAQAQHSEQKSCDGTGLGLSICHQLAYHMNGSVHAESTYGEGSRFWIEMPVDAHSELCPIYEDVSEFQSLKIVVYSKNSQHFYKEESFMRYADIFGMNAKIVDNLEDDFDIALFVDEDVDKSFKTKALNSGKKFIAMVSKPNDEYDKYDNVTSISFPMYCSKIRDTFNELLNPDSYSPHKHEVGLKFIGHILVAEDNEANQELIKILLQKYGLTFDLASNGYEAVELYKLNNYDMILMDEQMPVMDGNEAVKKITEYEIKKGLRHTPVSALTANVIKGAKERGLLSGFDSFLGKPIILKELERVFALYLKINTNSELKVETKNFQSSITGLDAIKLKEELMLSEDELIMLLTLFIKKMKKQIPELSSAIKNRDYKKIALKAHSIKGSSGNFRIEVLQNSASEMEQMAKSENSDYDYEKVFKTIKKRVQEIDIS